jgi:hypothetical protein
MGITQEAAAPQDRAPSGIVEWGCGGPAVARAVRADGAA